MLQSSRLQLYADCMNVKNRNRIISVFFFQSTYSVLSFMRVLWPDFSIWNLYAGVLYYQRNYEALKVLALITTI